MEKVSVFTPKKVTAPISLRHSIMRKTILITGASAGLGRGMAREFQGHLDQAMKETGFDEVKKEFDNIKNPANFIEPTMAKKAAEDASKKQVDDFNKLFGEAPPADAPKASPETPAAAS